LANLCHGEYSLQLTHQSDAASNHSHPVLLTGRLIAPDFVIN